MPYNSAGTSFASRAVVPIWQPAVKEPTINYINPQTNAQLATNSALTAVSVTSTATLCNGATNRTNGINVIVPSDMPPVTFANVSTLVASPPNPAPVQPVSQTFAPGNPGFTVPSGGSIGIEPFKDALYAITPVGVTATIYYINV